MKKMIIFMCMALASTTFAAEKYTEKVLSGTSDVNPASVQQVFNLYRFTNDNTLNINNGLNVNLVVVDLGGTTDVSPTQKLVFTLFDKREMTTTQANFEIGTVYKVNEVKRIGRGLYQIKASAPGAEDLMPQDQIITVNAVKAIDAIKAVDCGEEFDCEASVSFSSDVTVTRQSVK